MKKLRRVIGSVANLTSGRSEEQPSTSTPKPSALSASRRSVSGPLHETSSPQRGSYYSYETQSLDSFNSGLSSGTSQVDPYSKVDKHFTKLHKWAYLGDTNKLKKFIKKVPVDAQDSEGKTALHHAAAQGHGDALLFLLGSKSNVELKDNAGMTAFLRAVERSQQHIVQMLLQRRVDMNVADYQGNSSIHLVAKTGATDLLIMLLECGSDCDTPNTLGRTPLHVACTENQEEAVEALLRHGASVNVADKEGVTPLMVAAKLGSVPLVEALIDNGANISPVDASKWTAADYARFTNHNQLHHRLKTLLDKEGGVSLIPQGLLSVSDEGSDQTDGAAGGVIKKPCDNEEEDAADNSWSDTSDVNSVKEKPKLNLTKFLPSSDESTENVVPAITEPPEGAMGPPKPPRLYASSSSLASDKLVIGRSDDVQEKDDSVKDNDSWKSSSEDEKPKVKNLGLFMGNLDSSSELRKSKEDRDKDPIMKSRVGRDDLMLELGLNDMNYEVSDEDISFEEEKPDLPLEGTPTKDALTLRNKTSPEHRQRCGSESEHPSPSAKPLTSDSHHCTSPENKSSVRSVSPPLSSVRSGNSKFLGSESPVKSPAKKSPKKSKLHHPKSSTFDSDSDEGGSALSRPHRRKKQEMASLSKQVAVDEDSWDSPKFKSHSNKGSRKSSKDTISLSLDSLPGHQKTDKMRPNSGKPQKSTQEAQGSGVLADGLLPPAGVAGSSRTSTLSTAVGTLGREGTMQEVEEMWEANPSRKKPKSSSGSSSSPQDSESSHKLDDSTGKSRKEDTVRAKDGACYNVGSGERETHVEVEDDGHGGNNAGESIKMDVDNGDTAHDVSDDDFGSSGVEDLLASKVKVTNPASHPISAVRALLLPKQNVAKEEQSSKEKHQQSVSPQNKPQALRKQKSLSPSPREADKKQSTKEAQVPAGKIPSVVFDADKTSNSKKESTSPFAQSSFEVAGVRAPHRDALRSGLGGIVHSDEESVGLDHLASSHSLEEGEDRMSVTSTETEESAHINAGLKDSLLVPLSTLPDVSNVGQLQDLVRELRLKLEKEFGRRKDLEARVSSLKQQEKQSRLLSSQQELSSQQMQQEISSLVARVKQLEYQGRTEQDSSLLKDHTLQDTQQRCGELEEQCGALQLHAQQQEQMVNSLMVQLQTKERINLTLQDKLEELSSQTK
ncbi:Ankyrin repeat domain-containing protein 7 [Portunus trituberculatus]|uniref:Ankyrin repeat domain-containing protein 7 n=1 Tax=Portunus trituberculatus TaxID=210409 RepID=A0A5B7DHF6_PORTR|nr:Ankyrin repeat domain-containing protein 7 [Portunus trituberculatus]